MYIYIYIYIIKSYFISKRERERERERIRIAKNIVIRIAKNIADIWAKSGLVGTVKFLRIFFKNLLCGFGENPEILVTSIRYTLFDEGVRVLMVLSVLIVNADLKHFKMSF